MKLCEINSFTLLVARVTILSLMVLTSMIRNLAILFCLLCTSCKSHHQYSAGQLQLKIPMSIVLQPFEDISSKEIGYVLAELKKVYPSIQLNHTIPLPRSAWYPSRNRYRADSLIHILERNIPENEIVIGLTTKDISTSKGDINDWGVMGLGFCPGKACVVSTFRLSKKQQLDQLFKVSIHELGHTQGLPHCEVKSCFMRDAEGGNPTNEETGFCEKCKKRLIEKGWKF